MQEMTACFAWSNFACASQRSGITGFVISGEPDAAGFTSWQYAQPGKTARVLPLNVPICASGPNVAVLKKIRRSKSSPLPNCSRKAASFC